MKTTDDKKTGAKTPKPATRKGLYSVGDDATSYQGNQRGNVICCMPKTPASVMGNLALIV